MKCPPTKFFRVKYAAPKAALLPHGLSLNFLDFWIKDFWSKGAREEIREVRDERDDLNNPADKLREEKDERLYKRAEEHEEMHY